MSDIEFRWIAHKMANGIPLTEAERTAYKAATAPLDADYARFCAEQAERAGG